MYERIIKYEDVLKIVSNNHKIPNKSSIKRAYDYALKKHEGQNRQSGEAYILHPLRVAKFVAEWGFESDVVIAALLHDVAEDCHTPISEINELFGSEVASMVDTVTKLSKDLQEMEGLTKEELNNLSDAKLQKYMSDKALYIKLADRLDNLNTIDCFKKEKQINKARHTREILIPMAIQVGAFKIIDDLEELCFKIEHEKQYDAIVAKKKAYDESNIRRVNQTIVMFEKAFLKGCSFKNGKEQQLPHELKPYRKFISGFITNERSIVSIYRQITHEAENLKNDFDKLASKTHTAYYDLTLIFDDIINSADEGFTPYDIFYKYYEEYFMINNICILNYTQTTHKDCTYFLLCDEMDNLYRLFIRTEETYLKYKLGEIVEHDSNIKFVDVNEIEPRDTYKPKIKVFKRNGASCYIDAGATALDFAFLIHSDMGLHFDYALINKERAHVGIHYILNDGDEIEIVVSEEITAKVHWFRHAKTSRAVNKLVEYFS